jgi:hypothetical protein
MYGKRTKRLDKDSLARVIAKPKALIRLGRWHSTFLNYGNIWRKWLKQWYLFSVWPTAAIPGDEAHMIVT